MRFSKEDTLMIKGVAILMLLFYHLFYYEPMFLEYNVIFAPFELQTIMKGSRVFNICVSIFLFLSVYGIYKGYEKIETQKGSMLTGNDFLWLSLKRYFSLMIGYLAVFISVLVFFSWDMDVLSAYGSGFRGGYYFLLDLLGLSKFFGFDCLNGSWWYLQVAIIIIFVMPFLYKAFQKWEYYMIPVLILLPYVFSVDYITNKYRITVLLALVCARYDLLEKLIQWDCNGRKAIAYGVKGVITLVSTGIFWFLRQYEGDLVTEQMKFLAEGCLAFSIICVIYLLLSDISVLKKFFGVFGKYSLSMYFSHLFFSYYFVTIRGYIFSAKYFGLIFIVQIAVTLLYSVLLDKLLLVCKIKALTEKMRNYFDRKVIS